MDSDKLDIHALPWITDTSNWNSVRLISVMRTFTSFMLHVLSSTEGRHLGTMLTQINWTVHRIYVNEKKSSKMFLISWVRNDIGMKLFTTTGTWVVFQNVKVRMIFIANWWGLFLLKTYVVEGNDLQNFISCVIKFEEVG